jgi:isocitrate/isopropylmalate dehydrogenase
LGAVLSLFFITLPYGFVLVIFPVMYLLLLAANLFGDMENPDDSHIIGSNGVVESG